MPGGLGRRRRRNSRKFEPWRAQKHNGHVRPSLHFPRQNIEFKLNEFEKEVEFEDPDFGQDPEVDHNADDEQSSEEEQDSDSDEDTAGDENSDDGGNAEVNQARQATSEPDSTMDMDAAFKAASKKFNFREFSYNVLYRCVSVVLKTGGPINWDLVSNFLLYNSSLQNDPDSPNRPSDPITLAMVSNFRELFVSMYRRKTRLANN